MRLFLFISFLIILNITSCKLFSDKCELSSLKVNGECTYEELKTFGYRDTSHETVSALVKEFDDYVNYCYWDKDSIVDRVLWVFELSEIDSLNIENALGKFGVINWEEFKNEKSIGFSIINKEGLKFDCFLYDSLLVVFFDKDINTVVSSKNPNKPVRYIGHVISWQPTHTRVKEAELKEFVL